MSDIIRNIIRFGLFILIQVYVLNKIPFLHQFIRPYIYFLFILWLPFSIPRVTLLVIGFFTGLILDYYANTPGLHAAACTLIAYIRPFLISILTPKESPNEQSYREPSPKALGWTPYLIYCLVLTVFHNGYVFLLQMLSFGGFLVFLGKIIASSAISMLLIVTTELLFQRKLSYRTNTAS